MVYCACGRLVGDSRVHVVRKPCRCGLPPRKIKKGAPHIWWKMGDPKRRKLGLPDETDSEKAVKSRWV